MQTTSPQQNEHQQNKENSGNVWKQEAILNVEVGHEQYVTVPNHAGRPPTRREIYQALVSAGHEDRANELADKAFGNVTGTVGDEDRTISSDDEASNDPTNRANTGPDPDELWVAQIQAQFNVDINLGQHPTLEEIYQALMDAGYELDHARDMADEAWKEVLATGGGS